MKLLVPTFKAQWFITIMGTGMSASLLLEYPFPAYWLRVCGYIMFGICSFCLSWCIALALNTLIRSPEERHKYLFHQEISPFLGCFAMGYTSWLTSLTLILDGRAPIPLYVLWWISNVISMFTAWVVPFYLFQRGNIRKDELSTTLLLPVVALTVTSASGGTLCQFLPDKLILSTTIITFLLWANAICVSFMFLTLYLSRLLFYKFPPRESIFTSFIPIGFLGQGSFAILLCGHNFQSYFLRTASNESTVEAIVVFWICLLSALFLQSMGIVVTSLAIASVLSYGTHKFHYGWWAMTFPLGTMSHAMTQTGVLTDWYTFKVVGAMYGTASIFMTLICICGSSYQVYQWVLRDSEYDIESEAETKLATISSNTHSVHV